MAPAPFESRLQLRLPCARLWCCVCDGTTQAPGRPVATGRSPDDADYEDERQEVLVFMDVDCGTRAAVQRIAVLDAGTSEQEEHVIAQAAKALAEGYPDGLGMHGSTHGCDASTAAVSRDGAGEREGTMLSKSGSGPQDDSFDDVGEETIFAGALMPPATGRGLRPRAEWGVNAWGRQTSTDFDLNEVGCSADDGELDRFVGFIEVGTLDDERSFASSERSAIAQAAAIWSHAEPAAERWQEDSSLCDERVELGPDAPELDGDHQSRERHPCIESAGHVVHDSSASTTEKASGKIRF